jgi:hypothetical protein
VPSAPETVGHPEFRSFKRARSDANRALSAILVALRLGTYELGRLPRSQSESLLGEYYRDEIPDIGDFNYRVSKARGHMQASESDLAYMAVPFATALYEAYLTDLATLVARDGHPRVPRRAGATGLHTYLGAAGVALPAKEGLLFEAIRTIRNSIVHSAGVADDATEAAVAAVAADTAATDSWLRIARATPPPVTAGSRIPLRGRDALIALYSVAQCAYALNHEAATVITKSTWADAAILDFRRQSRYRWAHGLTDIAAVRRVVDRSYGLVQLTDEQLSAAVRRAPHQQRLP